MAQWQRCEVFLLAQVRWLDRRLHAAHRRAERLGLDTAGPQLLQISQLWLATYQAMNALIRCPKPQHVARVRFAVQAAVVSV